MVPTVPADPPSFVRLVAHPLRWRLVTELARSDLRVRELVGLIGESQNLVSYHLRLLRRDGLVTATRSTFDGRDSYYHLDLDHCARGLAGTGAAMHPALVLTPRATSGPGRVSVLFACTGNSARSPIAEALLRHHTAGRVNVTSGGSSPKPAFHPNAVRVLEEQYGVDVADRTPRSLDTLTGRRFDHVITLCDKVREVCPEFGDKSRRTHWSIPDPGDANYSVFQRVAAEIDTRIRYLLPVLALES
jgi:protein-tyrosine-phosphatase/DNA-binding transcriptional ArsR family regulator